MVQGAGCVLERLRDGCPCTCTSCVCGSDCDVHPTMHPPTRLGMCLPRDLGHHVHVHVFLSEIARHGSGGVVGMTNCSDVITGNRPRCFRGRSRSRRCSLSGEREKPEHWRHGFPPRCPLVATMEKRRNDGLFAADVDLHAARQPRVNKRHMSILLMPFRRETLSHRIRTRRHCHDSQGCRTKSRTTTNKCGKHCPQRGRKNPEGQA